MQVPQPYVTTCLLAVDFTHVIVRVLSMFLFRYHVLLASKKRISSDGLSSLKYKLISTTRKALFTHIRVAFNRSDFACERVDELPTNFSVRDTISNVLKQQNN